VHDYAYYDDGWSYAKDGLPYVIVDVHNGASLLSDASIDARQQCTYVVMSLHVPFANIS
jgi:hypothetical protein